MTATRKQKDAYHYQHSGAIHFKHSFPPDKSSFDIVIDYNKKINRADDHPV